VGHSVPDRLDDAVRVSTQGRLALGDEA